MASRTYSENVIVLRKTRLREADLIVTLLAEDGRQVRAVAKGASKPTSSFASRLELYAEASVLLVEGRSLDIVKEARLVNGHAPLRFDYERSICAAPIAELLAHTTQDKLPVGRLFPMTTTALDKLETIDADQAPLVMAAFLLKAASLLGFRPSLAACAECGQPRPAWNEVPFSFAAGGTLCADCAALEETTRVSSNLLDWADALIHTTFAELDNLHPNPETLKALLRFVQEWCSEHLTHLKSLPFALSLPATAPEAPESSAGR